MLKTAIAPVKHEQYTTDATILFYEVAQRSFITDKLARELNIQRTTIETIQLSAVGDTGKNVRHLESATVFLRSEKGDNIPIHVVIIPDIAIPMKNHVTKSVLNLLILKDSN